MLERSFWIVWCEGGGYPVVKHPTARLATAEAERLARGHPGRRFVVLQSVFAREVNDMVRVDYDNDPNAPF